MTCRSADHADVQAALARSLAELNLDYVDLCVFTNPSIIHFLVLISFQLSDALAAGERSRWYAATSSLIYQLSLAPGKTLAPEAYPTIVDTWNQMEKLLESGAVV